MSPELLLLIAFIAFLAEYVDSSLGMGYGTSLTPALLILGFSPIQIVPLVLLSEFLTGILAGVFHHALKNVDFNVTSQDLKVAIILTACSLVGVTISIFIAVNVQREVLAGYIGFMVLILGIVILLSTGRTYVLNWGKVVALGLVAAFNKGMTGGGYGPVATGGQMMAGVRSKSAIGVTSLSEGLTSLAGFVLYLLVASVADFSLAIPLIAGGLLSVPVAAFTVRKVHGRHLRVLVGIAVTVLGVVTLARLVI